MTCAEAENLLHALLDGELDAEHVREVEGHLAACSRCSTQLGEYRAMREAISAADMGLAAPVSLRRRIEAALPSKSTPTPSWRTLLNGFAMGTVLSAALAASLVITVVRADQDRGIENEIVSAHLRSLQAGHLIDERTSDQHTVKPWFNGKLEVAPPVVDLTAQGFRLLGGRVDYVDGKAVASIVYLRRMHVINFFVAQGFDARNHGAKIETVRGFNIRRWTEQGLDFWTVSDISADELKEFGDKIESAVNPGPLPKRWSLVQH